MYKEYLSKFKPPWTPGRHGNNNQRENEQAKPCHMQRDFDYDLVVIGGGSGGLSASKEAAKSGKKVACIDFVKPSPQGTTWSLGGTCINVGCIPKKLMHQAGLLGHCLEDSPKFGWISDDDKRQHDWNTLKNAVQDYIRSQNWKCKVQLRSKSVTYLNAFGEFVGHHELKTTDGKGKETTLTSRYFLLAMGGRPRYPDVPGLKEYCVSSDDLFSLSYCPGRTLVIGASYVSLECGGFLAALGMEVTIVVRSILLRGFDQEMAEIVGLYMKDHGVKFIRPAVVTCVEKLQDGKPGKHRVTMMMKDGSGIEIVEDFNTVLLAVGREPCTKGIGLDKVGVKLTDRGYIIHSDSEQSTCPYIYAVGDVLEGKPELTPVATQAGILLARRLFTASKVKMDYNSVPTVVFTPLEYGCIGLSEADAYAKYGQDDIEVYHSHFQPLEWTIANREQHICYTKLICVISQKLLAVGLHVAAPNVGEIIQGFTLGFKLGATKTDFDSTVGVHPTCAEVITMLEITKRSGQDASAGSC